MQAWRLLGALVVVGAVALGLKAYAHQDTKKDTKQDTKQEKKDDKKDDKKDEKKEAKTETPQKAADGPVWTFFDTLDTPIWQEMETVTTQTMKVQGQEVTQKQNQTFLVKWTPKAKKDNVWTVEYEIRGVKMNIQIGGNSIDYDSTLRDSPDNPLTQFFKVLVGAKFTFTIEKTATEGIKVKKVEGTKEFVDKLAAANEQLKDLLKTILSDEAIRAMSEPTFAAFPPDAKDFNSKDGWKKPIDMNMGPIGTYNTVYTYKVVDPSKNKDEIKVKVTGEMKYSPPKGGDATGLPFIIKDGELKSSNIDGTIDLNPKTGGVTKSTITMTLTGHLKIDIAGMVTDVTLNQEQRSELRTVADDRGWATKASGK